MDLRAYNNNKQLMVICSNSGQIGETRNCDLWKVHGDRLARTVEENVHAKAIVISQNLLSKAIYPAIVELLLGPLYTRSSGWCSIQITHSYWCKSWSQPQGLNYTRNQGWNRKNLFNLPQVTNKCWTLWPCIGPKVEEKDTIKYGKPICNPCGQCYNIY